jgi:hypothetical protein
MIVWGFTGSRYAITDAQLGWLYQELEDNRPNAVHHGACLGADAAVHDACLDLDIPVHVWPPLKTDWLAPQCITAHKLVTVHPAMHYLPRDREIVHAATVLKGIPRQESEPDTSDWGGTWYTINFALRVCKPVDICYPSGRIENRRNGIHG